MRRGISPLISAVLLIAFVITLFLVISNWIQKDVIKESMTATEEKLAGQLDCLSTEIEIVSACVVGDNVTGVQLNVDNTGDTNIKGLTIRVLGSTGDLAIVEYTSDTAPLGRVLSKSSQQNFDVGVTVSDVNKIEVYPEIAGTVCRDQVDTVTTIVTC